MNIPRYQFLSTRRVQGVISAFLMLSLVCISATSAVAQAFDSVERGRTKSMLNAVKNEIKNKYYDKNFKGVDLETKFKEAEKKLDEAKSLGQAFGIIAQAVLQLNDSHTRFYPPPTTVRTEYGFRMQMVGDKCLITAVKPGSDAASKGLKVGDEVHSVEGFRPNRKELWKINYYYNILSPRAGLNLKVLGPDAKEAREIDVAAKVRRQQTTLGFEDLIRELELSDGGKIVHRFVKVGNTTIWKMPTFTIMPESIDEIMRTKIGTSGNLILDLRGNGGGYVIAMERLAGYFVDADTKIADLKGRKAMDPQTAKTRGKDVFRGKLVVLVDSNSGSASEIFARFMQLQQRGVVIGDQSAGAVMQSQILPMSMGVDNIVAYGMNLTNADVIMSDGTSIEHAGVTPHIAIVPSASELAAGADKPLAAALQLLGHEVSPKAAGQMFPFEWPDEN